MKTTLRIFLFAAVLLAGVARGAVPPPGTPVTSRERAQGFREHTILAKPWPHRRGTADAEEARDGVHTRNTFARMGGLRVIALDDADAADRAIARLRATGRYEFVERDHFLRLAALPNDARLSLQWALNNTGQSGGLPGADIKASAAWDIIHDAPNVIVAILDSGVNLNHVDLSANLWLNPAPTFGDLHGASFVNGVRSGDPSDVNGHGTHVAGIVGATGNNGLGWSGVAWRVQIMPVRIMSGEGMITSSDFAAGVDYAISHGAQIMNASLFTDTHAQSDLTVLTAARDAGVILVVAAGNENQNLDATPHYYPGSYPLDNIVLVGASTRNETLASFSNYGAAVDLIAPGQDIVSLYFGDNSSGISLSGTSMASPHVAGALALLRAHFPTDTYRQLINRLLRGVDPLPAYAGKAQSGGRLNLFKALSTTDNRPFNDDFSARARLGGPSLGIRSNNAGAGAEAGEPAHAGLAAAATLWWQWTAPASGPVTLDTQGSGFDTTLAVYTGNSLATLTPVAANDDDGLNRTSRLSFSAQAGTAYQIALGGKNGASGLVILNLGTASANDAFGSATVLSGASTQIDGNNLLATREPGEPSILGFAGGASVWYRWTAPRSGRFQISATSLDLDALLGVYTGSAVNSLTLVAAGDNIARDRDNTDSLCLVDALAGTTYFICVDSKLAANTGNFTLSITDALWQAPTLRNLTAAPAIAADGTICVGSTDFNFYAFNPDGTEKWRVAMGDAIDRSTAAIAADGTAYFASLDGKLYATRADGTRKWVHDFGVTPSILAQVKPGSPALAADGTIYLKAADGYLTALNPVDGTTKWRFNSQSGSTYASPVVAPDGTIYQGSLNGTLYALNPDGSLRWTFAAGEPINASLALDAAGNIYFGVGGTGKFYSLTSAGVLRWTYTGAAGAADSSPAISADGATVYFGAGDGKLHAVGTADGVADWTYQLGGEVGDSSPAIDATGVVYIGAHDHRLYAISRDGVLKRTYDTGAAIDSSPAIFGTTLYIGSDDAKLYAFDIGAGAAAGPWPQYRQNASRLGRAIFAPSLVTPPTNRAANAGADVTFTATATAPTGSPGPTYQWQRDGQSLPGATAATFTVSDLQSVDAGLYRALIVNPAGSANTDFAILGVTTTNKVIGAGTELQPVNIVHPNGNIFDQVLLSGVAETITADAGQVTRTSYIDLNNDIVQVEFSGAGSLSLVLTDSSGPAAPLNYNQSTVSYMKGHAGIVIAGADESTNVSVFSVGRATAYDPTGAYNILLSPSATNVPANNGSPLFVGHATTVYDGIADIAFIAISSTNGQFGGVRTSNAHYFATKGLTGVYAPGVQFTGPVFVGNISAYDAAIPVLQIGSSSDTRITGGDLLQTNGQPVKVSGLTQLKFTEGSDSHGHTLPAKTNRAVLQQNGVDVTAQVVVNPSP